MADKIRKQISDWLFATALPHWRASGIDYVHGGFAERLTLSGEPGTVPFKRIRVQARQIYVFSHAALIDPDPTRQAEWRMAAAHGFDFMALHYWQGPDRGWAKTTTPEGKLLDTGADTYDQAFVLFAAAWHYRVSSDPRALGIARDTLAFIDQRLSDPDHGGMFDGLSETGALMQGPPRLQNPHMHLCEAMLALYQATSDAVYLQRAAKLYDMFRTRFFDGKSKTLGEYFTRAWQPLAGPQGQIVEPGHHFEWSWILHGYGKLASDNTAHEIAHQAYEFAYTHGIDPQSRLTYDEIDRDGKPLRASHRLWPQTEALKAFIAAAEYAPHEPARTHAHSQIAPTVDAIFSNYFIPGAGIWNDQLDQRRQPVSQFVPATSLYHLFLAFAETLRYYAANK